MEGLHKNQNAIRLRTPFVCIVVLPKIRDSYPKLNDEAAYGRQTRRELLKLAPLLAVPALFLPRVQMRVLASGMAWNDRFSRAAFSPGRNAPVFSDS